MIKIRRYNTYVLYAFFVSFSFIYLSYAGLSYAGYWHGDEFSVINLINSNGFYALIERNFNWSPRPLSETLLAGYFYAILSSGQRLIAPFLFMLWLFLLIIPFLGICVKKKNIPIIFIIFSLLVLTVSGENNWDALYWPQGAAAYIPTFAITLFITARVMSVQNFKFIDYFVLLLLSFSTEIGAFIAFIFSTLVVLLLFNHDKKIKLAPFIPLISSLVVIILTVCGRASINEGISTEFANIAGNFFQSIKFALIDFCKSIVVFPNNIISKNKYFIAIITKLLFIIGIFIIFKNINITYKQKQNLLLWIFTCLACCFIIIFLSYYKFGQNSTSRYITTQNMLIWIALDCGAILISQVKISHLPTLNEKIDIKGYIIVFIASLVPFFLTVKGIIYDYNHLSYYVEFRDRILKDANTHSDALVTTQCPNGKIIGYICHYSIEIGEFDLQTDSVWIRRDIMKYFGKVKLIVKPIDE